MFAKIQFIFKYLYYYFNASNSQGHGMHSPFVFELIRHVLIDKKKHPCYDNIESNKTNSLPTKYSKLIYRLANYFKPKSILEMGESDGVLASCFISNSVQVLRLIEAAEKTNSAFSSKNNTSIKYIDNIDILTKENKNTFDFVLIHGNENNKNIYLYFEKILPHCHENSIVIFDLIHSNEEMEQIWERVKANPSITISIDLFHLGLVFFRKEKREKEHFSIRF